MTLSAIMAIAGVTSLATAIIYRLIQAASTAEAGAAFARVSATFFAGSGVCLVLASILVR